MARRVNVVLRDTPPSRSAPIDSGRAAIAVISAKGVLSTTPARSLSDWVDSYGGRQTYSVAYDWVETFFREGGYELYTSPVRGPAAASASVAVPASTSGTAFTLTASSVGDWANGAAGGLSYQIVVGPSGGSNRQIVIFLNGVEVDRSAEFTQNTDAPAALASSDYVLPPVLGAGSGLVAAGAAVNLAGGTLDRTNITQTQVDAALAAIVRDLGPMQIASPDWQTSQAHTSLRAHGAAMGHERFALPDAPDGSTKSSLLTLGHAGQADLNASDGYAVLQPWLTIAGINGGAPRSVPPSAFVAAKCAQVDLTAGPAQAPAGQYGQASSSLILGVKATWSDQDQADLEAAGVATIIVQNGVVTLDTNRTGVNPLGSDAEWLQAGTARYRMSLISRLLAAAAPYAHITLTRQHIAQLDTALTGILMRDEQDGQLFLDTGEPAGSSFIVDTSDAVNTDATIAAGNLNAAVAFRPAPGADFVTIYLTKVGVGETLAA
jgi:hypothetical protein